MATLPQQQTQSVPKPRFNFSLNNSLNISSSHAHSRGVPSHVAQVKMHGSTTYLPRQVPRLIDEGTLEAEVTIYHNNDIHGAFLPSPDKKPAGGIVYLSGKLKQVAWLNSCILKHSLSGS